jgi:drug/metabolite transporter (DMT)-like permease
VACGAASKHKRHPQWDNDGVVPSVRVSPYLLLVLTNLFWAGNFVVGRAVHGLMPPAGVAFWRWVIALVVLAPFAAGAVRRDWTLVRQHWPRLAVMGVMSVCAFSVLLYTGLASTTATNALLLNSTAPVLIVIVAWMFAGERVTSVQATGIATSLCGVAVIVFKGSWEGVRALAFGTGDLWVLTAVTIWAAYTVLLRWRPREIGLLVFLAVTITCGVVATLPLYLIEIASGATTTLSRGAVSGLLYMGVLPSLVSHAFWNRAVGEVGGNTAGLFIHLTPVFGTLLAIIFLGEELHLYHVVGMLLILTGIVITTRTRGAGAA